MFGANKLKVLSFGLAMGTTLALGMLFLGIIAWAANWGNYIVEVTKTAYLGFDASIVGALIGAAWGFVDGFIGGVLISGFYNLFQQSVNE